MIDDEAIRGFIAAEGLPIRMQSGDNPWLVAGWLPWADVAKYGPGPAMARFLRRLADEFDRQERT